MEDNDFFKFFLVLLLNGRQKLFFFYFLYTFNGCIITYFYKQANKQTHQFSYKNFYKHKYIYFYTTNFLYIMKCFLVLY